MATDFGPFAQEILSKLDQTKCFCCGDTMSSTHFLGAYTISLCWKCHQFVQDSRVIGEMILGTGVNCLVMGVKLAKDAVLNEISGLPDPKVGNT